MQLFSPGHEAHPTNSSRRIVRVAVMIAFALFINFATLALNHSHQTAKAANWTQIWGDEFNGPANTGVNTSNWLYDLGTSYPGGAGNWGTGEIETMTNSTANVYQDGAGHLVIKAIRDNNNNWTSGRIETQRTDFQPPAGGILAVEASIQQPNINNSNGLGYWPAFWMLGAPFRGNYTNWPSVGEIDIMEDINGLSSEFGTFHCGVDPGGPCNETTGIGSGQRQYAGLQTSFHTYRMELDYSTSPQQIRWYLDGANFFTVNSNQVDATTWNNATQHGFFIIFNLAMGGGFPNAFGGGPTGATVSGAAMLVDYVHVFTAPGSGTPPPTATPPPPTPTPTGTGSGFTQGVTSTGSTSAQVWFQPSGWSAGYVILHYTIQGQAQQNINMSYNTSTSRWEYNIGGIAAGQSLSYSFTYQQNGLQYDTGGYTWTNGGGSGTGFTQGVDNTGSTSARAWFQPSGWSAGYVIVHYTIQGQAQQNVNMSYNSGTARWEYNINGITSGQTLSYSFTYQQNGLQYDTGGYSWTHP